VDVKFKAGSNSRRQSLALGATRGPSRDAYRAKEECSLSLPDPVQIGPGKTIKLFFGVSALIVGNFSSSLVVKTKESKFIIPLTGNRVKF
jgi:hypothetical protein